ncbi:MAG: hypothetical protein QOG53_3177 [Frankiales bacterium]|jgi:hypothetical protein|nr:hypothetical protein [Frankiales bacterium]
MPSIAQITAHLTAKVAQPISVVVARKSTAGGLEARKLSIASDAAAAFRDLCQNTVDSLANRSAVGYTADAELTSSEVFVLDDPQSLAELADLQAFAGRASTLPTIAPRDLDLSIQLYAVVAGRRPRAVFVRRVDPQIKYKAGGFLAIAGQQLRMLEEPAFSFSPGFDLILTADWALVLNQNAFERLFRDIGLIDAHVAEWITGITDHLPMSQASQAELRQVALRDSRIWRKLREIRRRGHLANVDLADVRKYARKVGMDPQTVVQNNELVFDPDDRFSFLHLLNEDLYKGPLTDETFEAQRKSPAP